MSYVEDTELYKVLTEQYDFHPTLARECVVSRNTKDMDTIVNFLLFYGQYLNPKQA